MAQHRSVPLLILFIGACFAGPLNLRSGETECSPECPESMTTLSYAPGKTYEYTYESDVVTSIPEVTEEHSSLHLRATVQIEVLSQCELALKVSDVSMQDSSPSQFESRQHVEQAATLKRALQERPLRFGLSAGRVTAVCPAPGEETWVLNIKRAVLSAFQNTMPTLTDDYNTRETDVSGECPVTYEAVGRGWGVREVKKVKDVLGCTERQGHWTSFQATPYNVDSAIQSLPVLKTTHVCEQKLTTEGRVQESSCTEMHILRPFSRRESGATTKVTYTLSFHREESDRVTTRAGPIRSRSTLLFDHTPTREETRRDYSEAELAINELCSATTTAITPAAPRLFTDFLRSLRRLDSGSLTTLTRLVQSGRFCDKANKFLFDAIPMLGSAASITVIRDLIAQGKVGDTEADIWLTSLAFVPQPTLEMLREAKALLDIESAYPKASLAVSTMVHSYCREHSDCEAVAEITSIVTVFDDKLRYNCKEERPEDHMFLLLSLKALGNMGHSPRVLPTLSRCAENSEISNEVRVAAINAYRRMGCDGDRTGLWTVYENSHEDAELRINAYTMLMKCADTVTLERVKARLESEEVNQVGSFVWTHLTNLQETSNVHKQDIRAILEDKTLRKAFDMDKRKFSRNVEWSAFSPFINAGAQLESNLIWSQSSFIPRSASVNLTVDLFGDSVNLLEVGGRVQGLERMLEKVFGPGEVPETTDVADLNRVDKRFNLARDDAKGSYYIRVFGNEIRYDDFHELDINSLKDRFNYLEWVIGMSKEHNVDFTKSIMFIDTSMTVPTAAGMPLKLSIDGAAVMNVQMSGKVDVRQMMSNPSNFDIDGVIKPSAAVEFCSEMGVDAFVTRTGLKMITSVYTNTEASAKVKLQDGRVFDMQINVPQERQQVVKADNKFFIEYRGAEREQKMIVPGRVELEQCRESRALGLELCGQISLPTARKAAGRPWMPITGPASIQMFLARKEPFTSYNLNAKVVSVENVDTARVSFTTPGGTLDREMTVEAVLNRPAQTVSFNLVSPWKKASVQGSLVNTDEQKRVSGSVTWDDKELFNLLGELAVSQKRYGAQYQPRLVLSLPNHPNIRMNADVFYRPGKKGEFSFNAQNLFKDEIDVKGSYMGTFKGPRGRYETDLQMTSGLLVGKFAGFYDMQGYKALSTRGELEYTYAQGEPQRVTFSTKAKNVIKPDLIQLIASSTFSTSLLPGINTEGNLDFMYTPTEMKTALSAGIDSTRRVVLNHEATYSFGPVNRIDMSGAFEMPYKSIDYSGRASVLQSATEFTTSGQMKYSADHEATGRLTGKVESRSPLKISTAAALAYPGRDMSFNGLVEEKANKEYHQSLNVELAKYDTIRINSVYKMLPRHELTSDLVLPGMPAINIKAYLKPKLTDMEAHAELNLDQQKYMADTTWLHRGNANAFSTRANAEVVYPDRSMNIAGSASRQGDVVTTNVETKWNAGRNDNEKATINAEITMNAVNPAANVKVQVYPNHMVEVQGSGKYETRGWYKTEDDIMGDLRLRTSFAGFENINARFIHDRTSKIYKNEAQLTWAEGKTVDASLNVKKIGTWSNAVSTLVVNTPCEAVRTIETTLTYNLGDTTLASSIEGTVNGQKVTVGLNGELDVPNHKFVGELKLTSPFEHFEAHSASARYTDNGSQYSSNVMYSWTPEKTIRAVFDMTHTAAKALANNGEVTISTPFERYNNINAKWNHRGNAVMFQNEAEMTVDGQKVAYQVEAMNKATYKKRRVEAKAGIQTPFEGAEHILFNLEHSHDRRSLTFLNTDASFTWATEKTISYAQNFNYDAKSNAIRATFISPFEGIERISLTSNTNNENGKITHNTAFDYPRDQRIVATGDITHTGADFNGQFEFTSPFNGIEKLAATARNSKQNGIWVSHGDLEYVPGKKIELDTKLGLQQTKMAAIAITSECPYMKSASIEGSFSGNARDFEAAGEVMHHLMDNKATIRMNARTSDVNNLSGELQMTSPCKKMSTVSVSATHRAEGPTYTTEGSIALPEYNGRVSNVLTMRNAYNFESQSEVEYLPGKKIEMTSSYIKSQGPNIRGRLVFKSPIEKLENVVLALTHEGPINAFTTTGELTYSPTEKIAFNAAFNKAGNAVSGNGRITTPFNKGISLSFSHDGVSNNFKNEGTLDLNGKIWSTNNEFVLRGYKIDLDSNVATPIPGYDNLKVVIFHQGKYWNFKNKGIVKIGATKIAGKSQLSATGNSLATKATFQLPFRSVRSLSIDVSHDGPATNFRNRANVQIGNKEVSGESQLSLQGTTLTATATLNLPVEDMKVISVAVNHEGAYKSFSNNALVVYGTKQVKGSSEYRMGSDNIMAKAKLELPVPEMETISLDFSHRGTPTVFTNQGIFVFGRQSVRADSDFSLRGNDMTLKANLHLPIPDVETISIDVSHNGPIRSFTNNAILTYGTKTVRGESLFNLRGNTLNSKAVIVLPISELETISIEVNHDGPAKNFNNNAAIVYGATEVRGTSQFSLRGTTLAAKASLELPIPGYKTMALDINHAGSYTNWKNNAALDYGKKSVSASTEFSLEGYNMDAKALLTIPVKGHQNMGIEISHKGESGSCISNVVLTFGQKAMSGNVELSHRGNSMSGKASLQTPFEGAETMSIQANHDGTVNSFTSSAVATYAGKTVSGNLQHSLRGSNLDTKLSLNIPTPISVEIKHKGASNDFENSAIITFGRKTVRGESKFTLRGTTLGAKASLSTPIEGMETVSVEINHNGPAINFNNNAVVVYGVKSIRAESQFSLHGTTMNAKATINLPIPNLETISLELNHNGPATEFTCNGIATYGAKITRGNVEFTLRGNSMVAKAGVVLPIRGAENYAVVINHDGPVNNFKTGAEVTYGAKVASGEVQLNHEGNRVNFKTAVKLPIEGIENIAFEIIHNGHSRQFNNEIIYTYGTRITRLETELSVQKPDVTFKIAMHLPDRYVEVISFEVTHKGPATNFDNNVVITYGRDITRGNTQFKLLDNALSAKSTIISPNRDEISAEISHEGIADGFKNYAVMNYGQKMVRADSEVTLKGRRLNGKASLQLPIPDMEILSIEVSHRGPFKNFKNNAVVVYGRNTVRGESELRLLGNTIAAQGSVNLPIRGYENIALTFNHEGTWNNWNNNAELTMGGDVVRAVNAFSLKNLTIVAKTNIQIPKLQPIYFEMNHKGPLTGFTNKISTAYGAKKIDSDAEFSYNAGSVTVKLDLSTPFDECKKMIVRLEHQGKNWRNWENNWTCKLNGGKYDGNAEFRWFGRLFRLKADANIPNEYSLKVNHKGFLNDFSNIAALKYPGQKISGTSNFRVAKKVIEGGMNIETTLNKFKNLAMTFSHSGDLSAFKTSASLTTPIKAYKNFAAEMSHNGNMNKFESGMKIETPFTVIPSAVANIKHEGTIENFKCDGHVQYKGIHDVVGSVSFDSRDGIQARANLNTPYQGYERFAGEMTHSGTPTSFRTTATVETPFARYQRMNAELNHNGNLRKFTTGGKIETTIPGYERFNAELSKEGSMSDFTINGNMDTSMAAMPSATVYYKHEQAPGMLKCSGRVDYNGKAIVLSNNWMKNAREMSGSTSLETPFNGYRKFAGTVSHNGDAQRFTSSATVETPFSKFERMSAEINHEGGYPFTTSAKVDTTYPGYERLHGELSMRGPASNFETVGSLETPYNPKTTLTYKHKNVANGFSCESNAVYAGKTITGTLSGTLENGRLQGEALVRTPYRGYGRFAASVSHSGTPQEFSTSASVETPIRPYERIAVAVNHNSPSSKSIDSSATVETSIPGYNKFALNVKRNAQPNECETSASVETPFRGFEKFGASMSHRTNGNGFSSTAGITTPISGYERFGAELSHNGDANRFTTAGAVTSSIRPYSNFGFSVEHNGQVNNFKTNGALTSSVPGYDNFGFELQHNKQPEGFKTTGSLSSPIRPYNKFGFLVDHAGNVQSFKTAGSVSSSIPNYEQMGYTLEKSGSLRNLNVKTNIETPYRNYRRINGDLSHVVNADGFNTKANMGRYNFEMSHAGSASSFRTQTSVITPHPGYERFAASVNHNGNARNFRTGAEITTSIPDYEKLAAAINHEGDMKAFKSGAELTSSMPGLEKLVAAIEKSGTLRNLRLKASAETPFDGFRNLMGELMHEMRANGFMTSANVVAPVGRFAASVDHKTTTGGFETTATASSPYRGYENFIASLIHAPHATGFKTNAEVTTSIPAFSRFAAYLEKAGTIRDLMAKAKLETPFEKFREMALSVTHSGAPSSFMSSARFDSTMPGYEKFIFNMNHKGDPTRFKTIASAETPFDGHEKYELTVKHNQNNKLKTFVELVGPSKTRFAASINHRGTAKNFNSAVKVNTPFTGYENMGFTVDHKGIPSRFQQSGTIDMPFTPQIKYTVSHTGAFPNFNTDATVEYSNKKIEATSSYKYTVTGDEKNYEGSVRVQTPYTQMRDFLITAFHKRTPSVSNGALEVTKNREKLIDHDYSYTSDGRRVTVNMRSPRPITVITNFHGDSVNFGGDAFVSWSQKMNIKVDLAVKNEENDKSLTIRSTMPRRIVGMTTTLVRTDDTMTHTMDLQWDDNTKDKLNYELEVTRAKRRNLYIHDTKFSLRSGSVNMETTVSNKYTPGRKYVTEVIVETASVKRMSLKSDLTLNKPTYVHALTFQHPRLANDAVLTTEATFTDKSTSGKMSLRYDNENFELEGSVADESASATDRKYTSSFRLAHPSSRLDFQYSGEMLCNRERSAVTTEAKYLMTSDQQFRTASLRAEINRVRRELSMQVVTPIKEYEFVGREESATNGVYRYTMVGGCELHKVRSEFELNVPNKDISLKVTYKPERFVHAYARYTSPREMVAEIYHQNPTERVQDAQLALNLKDDQDLTGRAYMRPDLVSDIKTLLNSIDLETQIVPAMEELKAKIQEEITYKRNFINEALEPLRTVAQSIQEDLAGVMELINNELSTMFKKNEFRMKEIYQSLRKSYRQSMKSVTDTVAVYRDITNKVWKKNYETAAASAVAASASASGWFDSLSDRVTSIRDQLKGHYQTARDAVQEAYENVRDHPTTQRFVDRVRNMDPTGILDTSSLEASAAAMSESSTSWFGLGDIINREEIKAVGQRVQRAVKSNYWYYKYLEFDQMLKEAVEDFYQHGFRALRANLYTTADKVMDFNKDTFTKWDPQNGDLEFEFHLPIPLDDLQTVPTMKIDLNKYITKAQELIQQYTPQENFHFWETFYKYKPSVDPRNWVPPFTASASISGNQHIMTFDKYFYEFAGECSYLLARDFIDGTFGVVVNYEKNDGKVAKKSITVYSNDKKINIFPDGRVIVDDAVHEMPMSFEDTTIIREQNILRLDNAKGISVTCDLAHDRCTVEVTGWYFGKTAGLFGTYNNEPVDDFTKSDHGRATDVDEFAASWNVGTRCRSTNVAVNNVNEASVSSRRLEMCNKYFQSTASPYRHCFQVVHPEAFRRMCLNEGQMTINQLETEADICNIASFYVEQCRSKEVPLRLPAACVSCKVEDTGKIFVQGDNMTITNEAVPQSADVVFVIEHAECTRDVVSKLKDLVDDLEKTLSLKGLKNNKYAIVGFGGEGISSEPHIQTIDGKIFNGGNKIMMGLDAFTHTAGPVKDALLAIRHAATLPFRAGVSKSIILVPCHSCQQTSTRFAEIQQLLLVRDVRFHVLHQNEFQLRGRAGQTSYIFGVDTKHAYTRKDAGTKVLKGDAELHSQVVVPKDLCVALTEQTRGSIFSAYQWTEARPFIAKRFLDVYVRLVADRAVPSDCQVCECVADVTGAGMSVCKPCARPNPLFNLLPENEEDKADKDGGEVIVVQPPVVTGQKEVRSNKNSKWDALSPEQRRVRMERRKLRRLQLQKRN